MRRFEIEYTITPEEQAERFDKLAQVIEDHDDRFDMTWWLYTPNESREGIGYAEAFDRLGEATQVDLLGESCETRGCIAGWTATLWGGELPIEAHDVDQGLSIRDAAQLLLGIDQSTARFLFDAEAEHQAASDAAAVCRNFARQARTYGEIFGDDDD